MTRSEWKIMPVEATKEMVEAGEAGFDRYGGIKGAYRAMVEAVSRPSRGARKPSMSAVSKTLRSEVVELLTYLSYNPDTGQLIWIDAPRASPSIVLGREAGCIRNDKYRYVRFRRTQYLAHRLCWELYYGEEAPLAIDHINGNKVDNRISNLRLATTAQNLQNRGPLSNNTSGYKGVSFVKSRGKFVASYKKDGVKHELGVFDDPAEAARAYDAAVHKVHGEFAYLNFPDEMPLSSPASSSPAEAEALPAGVEAGVRVWTVKGWLPNGDGCEFTFGVEAEYRRFMSSKPTAFDVSDIEELVVSSCDRALVALSPAPAQAGSGGEER